MKKGFPFILAAFFLLSFTPTVTLSHDETLLKKYCTFSRYTQFMNADSFSSVYPPHIFDNRRVIACGESSHGSHENQLIKTAMFRYLAEKENVRVFILEASYAEVMTVNDYIHGKEIPPDSAMHSTSFWVWRTQEIRDLIEWMRNFNKGKTAAQQLYFLGMDMQEIRSAAKRSLEFFTLYDPSGSSKAKTLLQPFTTDTFYRIMRFPAEKKQQRMKNLASVDSLAALVPVPADPAAKEDFLLALHEISVLRQSFQFSAFLGPRGFVERDSAMAENVKWIAGNISPGHPVFVCAHNEHVAVKRYNFMKKYPYASTGALLRDFFGDAYYSIGVDFTTGSFNALTFPGRKSLKNLRDIATGKAMFEGPMPCNFEKKFRHTLFFHVAKYNSWMTWVNCDAAKNDPALMKSKLLRKENVIHSIGAGFLWESACLAATEFGKEFDSFLFFKRSTPSWILHDPL